MMSQQSYTGIIVVVCVGMVLGGCSTEQSEESTDGIPVQTEQVQVRTLNESIQTYGSVEAGQSIRVSPEISGMLQSVYMTEGDTVQSGDTLFKLDDDKLRERLQARQGQLKEAKAQFKNAQRSFDRVKRLYDRDAVSAQERDDALEAFEQAQGRVERLKAEVQEARELLDDAIIRAPIAGELGELKQDEGNFVQSGQTLVELYGSDQRLVRFTVPERYSNRLETGLNVIIRPASRPDRLVPGRVVFYSPSVGSATRDVLVKAVITDPTIKPLPGESVRIELILERRIDRPVVHTQSLIPVSDGHFVFVVSDETAHRQDVRTGLRDNGWVEIKRGLKPDSLIIQTGHQNVSDGATVRDVSDNN